MSMNLKKAQFVQNVGGTENHTQIKKARNDMTTKKAEFLVEQLNPIFKRSTSIIRRLAIDHDNEDIMMINLCTAILYRVHYGSKNIIEVTYEIMENARG